MTRLSPAELDHRLRVAEAVVRDAGRLAAEHFARRELLSIDRKGAQDLVSEADRACEDLIVAGLARQFPEDGFLGEERGSRNPDAAAIWVIDPIDGTHNFLTGIPVWCVSIGLVVDGELVLGIIYHPLADELYSARSGGGAFLNGQPIRVSGETDLTRARVCVGFSYRRPVEEHVRAVEALLSAGCEYLRLGSGALGLALHGSGTLRRLLGASHKLLGRRGGLGPGARGGRPDERFPGGRGPHARQRDPRRNAGIVRAAEAADRDRRDLIGTTCELTAASTTIVAETYRAIQVLGIVSVLYLLLAGLVLALQWLYERRLRWR